MKLEPAGAAALAGRAMARRSAHLPRPASHSQPSPTRPLQRSLAHTISLMLVWLTVFSSFFVMREPAPFDALMFGLIFLLPVVGLTAINPAHLIYLSLWLVVVAAGFVGTFGAFTPEPASAHIGVTLYLVLASFVLAAFVARDPEAHVRLIFRAYVAAAVLAATLAIIGYFDAIPGSRALFTVFSRASGTFKDPNVFAPFLVPPMLYLLHEILARGFLGSLRAALALMILAVAMLLSFSRGGWINLFVSMAVYLPLAFVTARTDRQRARLLGLFGLLALVAALVILLALQSDAVGKLFQQRASLDQSYDQGPEGRFGGQLRALDLILQHPFGIGSLQFGGNYHPEDPHNVYISQFLNGGWLGGLTYIIILVASIAVSTRAVLQRTWAAQTQLVVYAALIGLIVEGFVVDTDHWRTFYIVLGLIWGLAFPSPRAEVSSSLHTALPIKLAMMPLRPPRRAPRIKARTSNLRMAAKPQMRKRRRREPRRKARIVVH